MYHTRRRPSSEARARATAPFAIHSRNARRRRSCPPATHEYRLNHHHHPSHPRYVHRTRRDAHRIASHRSDALFVRGRRRGRRRRRRRLSRVSRLARGRYRASGTTGKIYIHLRARCARCARRGRRRAVRAPTHPSIDGAAARIASGGVPTSRDGCATRDARSIARGWMATNGFVRVDASRRARAAIAAPRPRCHDGWGCVIHNLRLWGSRAKARERARRGAVRRVCV